MFRAFLDVLKIHEYILYIYTKPMRCVVQENWREVLWRRNSAEGHGNEWSYARIKFQVANVSKEKL